MENNGNIAILMSTYNGETYLIEQLESILNQTYQNFKLFIRDDGSSDNTKTILEQYCKKYPNKITIINDNNNLGAAQSFLSMIGYVSKFTDFDYFMFSDQDDVWLDNKVLDSYQLIKSYDNDKPLLCHTDLTVVDKDLNIINSSFIKMRCLQPKVTSINHLLIQNNITGCTMIFNRKLLDIISKNDVSNIAMHDWWITLIASVFGEIHFLDKQTILYRQHGKNVVGATNVRSFKFIIKRLLQKNQVRKTLQASIMQAKQFKLCFEDSLSNDYLNIINEFISLDTLSKVKKWIVIFKNNFFKQGIIQIIGELIFI